MKMIEAPAYISNHQAVIAAYGYWPSCHDAVVRLFEINENSIKLTLHVFQRTPKVDRQNNFVLRKHRLITFKFENTINLNLSQFVADNTLDRLELSPVSDYQASGIFHVHLGSVMGDEQSGSFETTSGEIVSVVPCDAQGQVSS